MSERLIRAMASMGYTGLSQICNQSVFSIVNEVELFASPAKLARIILEIYGPKGVLEDSSKRNILLQNINKSEALLLNEQLNLSFDDAEPWGSLQKCSFKNEKLEILYSFFDLEISTEEHDDLPAWKFRTPAACNYGLFSHQERAAQKVKVFLHRPREKVLLHMPTGSGKTRTAMSVSCDFLRNSIEHREDKVIIWLCDTEELCDQAASEFLNAWSNLGVGETNLYRLYGSQQIDLAEITTGFVVCGLQKLNSVSLNQQNAFYKLCHKAKLIIFDEAHKAIAATYKQAVDVIQQVGDAALLGLSATPGRSTFDKDENVRFAEFFNHNKVSLEVDGYDSPVDYLLDQGYLSNVTYHDIEYKDSDIQVSKKELALLSSGGEPDKSLLKRLGLDQKRNLKILSLAIDLVADNKQIILFAPSVESADGLYALLRFKDINAGLVTSDTPASIRRRSISEYKSGELNVLINFGVLTTGFDAPKTDVAIIARPTNSLTLFSQMVGRATRGVNAGGTDNADVYIIKDTLPGLRDLSRAFTYWDDSWEI